MLIALAVFLAAYTASMLMITVFYHRALAHRAVVLSPRMQRFVFRMGNWVTGMDPLAWVCMHRAHHVHSDTPEDPHSPVHVGVIGVGMAQLRAYEKTLVGLARRKEKYTSLVKDLDGQVHWTNRKGYWWLPHTVHLVLAITLGFLTTPLIGAAYLAGILSHPAQGWAVNALAHTFGRRNFDIDDNSRNNWWVALLVFGEGLQNNHHRYPASARFSVRWHEPELGWVFVRLFHMLGLLTIRDESLAPVGLPEPAAAAAG